jgi:hypothetical protein
VTPVGKPLLGVVAASLDSTAKRRRTLLHRRETMKRLFLAALAATCFATGAHAQSSEPGPFVTPSGRLQFVQAGSEFSGMLDAEIFDRFGANRLTHFDDVDQSNDTLTRMLVLTDRGPVLYDFRRHPPLVQRLGKRIAVRRVFWQGDEVVLRSSTGWFRFKGGVLTNLQSSKMTFH